MTSTSDRDLWDSRELLKCCSFPSLRRQLGVLASSPFHHVGLNAECVDIHRETIEINTRGFGSYCPVTEASVEIRKATKDTIADLDKVISELTVHRDRLAATLSEESRRG